MHPIRHRCSLSLLAAVLAASLAACGDRASSAFHRDATAADAPSVTPAEKFNLGKHSRTITTSSPEAQKAFDRGLTLAYAFSHNAAEEEFKKAIEADPKCAMAWWGIALVHGPHINFPVVPPEHAKAAWEALSKAKGLVTTGTDVEKGLVAALEKRYASPQPEDRAPLDVAYADAMKALAKANPNDADLLTLAAEAMMDLHPWDLYKPDGSSQPWTPEILGTLTDGFNANSMHPGVLHLLIHAIEASTGPGVGLAPADLLKDLVPGAGHLVHMPAHIYARVGRWADAAAANLRAIEADAYYRTQHKNPGFYVVYMAHNHHFLAFTAMMRGRSAEAIAAARTMVSGIPEAFLKEMAPVADGFAIFVSEVLMRFGKWDEVLAEPEPKEYLPLSRALWHFTRGVAQNAKGDHDSAVKEFNALLEGAKKVPKEWTFGNNPASVILDIATKVLEGEMLAKAERFDGAIPLLEAAVKAEDAMKYDEPPDWIQPVRHTLGAALMAEGQFSRAEAVYRADLVKWPENAWSLLGLSKALHAQGQHEDAHAVDARVKAAWADADVQPTSTCLCLPGK